jgi:hypothetical protein
MSGTGRFAAERRIDPAGPMVAGLNTFVQRRVVLHVQDLAAHGETRVNYM